MTMTTVELKKILFHRIARINDKNFLSAINTIIETKYESPVYKTTPEQRKSIKEGREQIANGEYYSNEEIESEIDKWLEEE
jgi:predicted transcriptional regulator